MHYIDYINAYCRAQYTKVKSLKRSLFSYQVTNIINARTSLEKHRATSLGKSSKL